LSPRLGGRHDLSGARYVLDRDELDPFDMTDDGTPHVPGRLRLPPRGAGLRRRLTPLAAGCVALGACPYLTYCPSRLALASLASGAPGA